MNLTFPMALDYRRGDTWQPPKCLAANPPFWQAGIARVIVLLMQTDQDAERNP
ncbi:MAG TPA: hypothetical protein VL133_05665 [Devosia sp.]|nr:hypothetical protein [Devosia sp.]